MEGIVVEEWEEVLGWSSYRTTTPGPKKDRMAQRYLSKPETKVEMYICMALSWGHATHLQAWCKPYLFINFSSAPKGQCSFFVISCSLLIDISFSPTQASCFVSAHFFLFPHSLCSWNYFFFYCIVPLFLLPVSTCYCFTFLSVMFLVFAGVYWRMYPLGQSMFECLLVINLITLLERYTKYKLINAYAPIGH